MMQKQICFRQVFCSKYSSMVIFLLAESTNGRNYRCRLPVLHNYTCTFADSAKQSTGEPANPECKMCSLLCQKRIVQH